MGRRIRILFIATREPSYPRVAMTLEGLQSAYDVDAIWCDSPSYPKRLLHVAWQLVTRRLGDYDLLFVAFFAQPIMPLVRLLWRGPLLLDAFISLYDSLVLDKGLTNSKGWVSRCALWLDRFAIRNAQVALVDTLQHAALFEELVPHGPRPQFLRLWAAAQEQQFLELPPLEYDPAQAEPFHVLFWGAFIPLQGVDVIVRAFALLSPRKIQITIVGVGQTYAECVALAAREQLEHVSFVGWKTPEQLVELAARSHLLLGIFGATEKAKRVIPNKAFQALALGKPLLTGRSAGIAELLTEDADVLLCEMADPHSLAQGIEQVRLNYARALEIGRRGRATFLENCSHAKRVEVLQQAVTSTRGVRG